MKFIDRKEELNRLDGLMARRPGGLAVVYGRRRIGKTRLLTEWTRKHGGLYTVADLSSARVQMRYFASAASAHLPGFGEVDYPDWQTLLNRLAREARQARWRGPVVFDEFPYLVLSSPEIPSVLQRWVDHDVAEGRLVVAVAGSSQRMMQGLVLAAQAPLYGRAREILHMHPLDVRWIGSAFGTKAVTDTVLTYAAWGGVPRYWELAVEVEGDTLQRFDRLALNPLGPLHREPDHLLIEEVPSALEVRPVLDAIGSGAHRVSEIAARMGHRATSLSRPLDRLAGMGLVTRQVPFGEPEKRSRRSLYRVSDPFFRLWFRVVAPHRAFLATASPSSRRNLLRKYWGEHVGMVWETLCRQCLVQLGPPSDLGKLGPWTPASRWWRGNAPEWDLISESADKKRLVLGEAKWSSKPLSRAALERAAGRLDDRPPPDLPHRYSKHERHRALFVPAVAGRHPRRVGHVWIVTGKDLLR